MNYPKLVDTAGIVYESCGFSEDRYRFVLRIPFCEGGGKGLLRVIMKNPGVADIEHCDRTMIKVCGAAKCAGFDGVIILNLFPFRATRARDVYENYYCSPEYQSTMKRNAKVIREYCTDAEVVFAWGTNTVSPAKEFREEYDRVIQAAIDTVKECAAGAVGIPTGKEDSDYYLHGLRWWKTILAETYEACDTELASHEDTELLHPVTHHNMFGPSCEVAGINDPEDFEIYCRYEDKVCCPGKCNACPFFAGDEEGQGKTCIWPDVDGNLSADEHVVQHSQRYMEAERVNVYDENDFDFEPIVVCLAMWADQAKKEHTVECLNPSLPNPKETYFKLDFIPDELCLEKQRGWAKKISAYKYNAKEIFAYLYPEGIDFSEYQKLLDTIEGDRFYIYGFGD